MRLSQAYIPTQKEIPSDAIIPSHRLMLRAGLIRPLASGVYSYLPFGWRAMKKAMTIIREEMDRIGGQELHLPVLNPIEIWDESGRNADFGDDMFRLIDRKERQLALAPTHEEVICDLARKYVKSYKDLPQIWYQIQTKFRDEPRPRSGVIRARQFIMKDSYTLDTDADSLDKAYQFHAQAYRNIFKRCGLRFIEVGASSGLMGGSGSQEFMVESESGEDTLVLCTQCDYAANIEVATSVHSGVEEKKSQSLNKVHTPGKKTIEDVSSFLNKESCQLMKSLLYFSDDNPALVLIRGDYEVNESKLISILGTKVRPAQREEVLEIFGAEPGFVGPVNMRKNARIIADFALKDKHDLMTGANEKDYHLSGIELERDVQVSDYADIRCVKADDHCSLCGADLRVANAIELGHIFQLGTKYSESMKAFYTDNSGKDNPIFMGSYGIGIERIVAASIEQNHDDKGIVWDPVLAPYHVHIIPINMETDAILKTAETLYQECCDKKIETLMDDRIVSAGYKFKDADLLGLPLQIIIGDKWIREQKIEIKVRKTGKVMYESDKKSVQLIQSMIEKL